MVRSEFFGRQKKSKPFSPNWDVLIRSFIQVPGTARDESSDTQMLVLDTMMVSDKKGKCIPLRVDSIQLVAVTGPAVLRFLKLCLESAGKTADCSVSQGRLVVAWQF